MKENNSYKQIIIDINNELIEICDKGRMEYHIIPVVKNAKKLAEDLNADIEVVEIASYLHDVTRILGDVKNHHITGAEYAEKFLNKYNYPNEKIIQIKNCIRNHRGSVKDKRDTLEEKIVATADAMAHIQYPLPLFYTWYGKRKCDMEEGRKEIKEKIQRSWDKIEFEKAKEEVSEKYNFLMEVLANE